MRLNLYIIMYFYEDDTDAWPVFSHDQPDEDDVVMMLKGSGSWKDEENEFVEVRGLFNIESWAPVKASVGSGLLNIIEDSTK